MSDAWIKRRARPEDHQELSALWTMILCQTYPGRRVNAHRIGSESRDAFRADHAAIPAFLLTHPDVITEVIAHPEDDHVLFGFASHGPAQVVHQVMIKRNYARAGFGAEMVRDLVGPLMELPCICSQELPEMHVRSKEGTARCGVSLPSMWIEDPLWLARQLLRPAR